MTNATETLIASSVPTGRRIPGGAAAAMVGDQRRRSLFVRLLEAVLRRYPHAADIGWQYASHRQWHLDFQAPAPVEPDRADD